MAEERVDGARPDRSEAAEARADRSPRNQRSRNDVSWYSRNPSLLQAAASIPFPYRPGMSVPYQQTVVPTGTTLDQQGIPGIMALNWWPTLGYSQTATDPASIVGKEIFAKVREKFSGSIDADAPDFVIYIMALDSVFSYIAHLKRIYRVLTAYTSENHYIPDGMLRAFGLSAAQIVDLKEHRMQFYQIINELVFMTRKFNLPAAFDIINRHYWLNDNVYMDAESINSQFYVFNCLGYYSFELKTAGSVQVGGLTMKTLTIPNTDVAEYYFTFGRSLIDALAGSDDAYIISGYLMRAYEGYPAFQVDELALDDRLIPHYDPEVLMQIENARPIILGTKYSTSAAIANDVTQDPSTNAVVCVPTLTATKPSWYTGMPWNVQNFLSIRSDAPTVADVTIATRLKMGVWKDNSTDTNFDCVIACGSEILDTIQIWTVSSNNTNTKVPTIYSSTLVGLVSIAMDATGARSVADLCNIQSFDWHPILPVVVKANSGGTFWYSTIAGDVHNFTMLSDEQLHQINRVCLYSEFNAYGQI